jgi:endonuclease/exonuclease/phosphatase (EEP) superfamily protein YafD
MNASRPRRRLDGQAALLWVSAVYWIALTATYALEWDAFGAVTVWPPWLWAGLGVVIMAPGISRRCGRASALLGLAWAVFLVGFCEEAWYPVRALRAWPAPGFEAARKAGHAVRVVSVNCCAGEVEAALEARRFAPDVVLLQESPGPAEMPRLARELFGAEGGWVCVGDNAVLARGTCTRIRFAPRSVYPYLWCRVKLAGGPELEAVSVHLVPPQLRTDLWHPAAWTSTAGLERGRRAQLTPLVQTVAQVPPGTPLVVGGDWNAPARDGILRLLRPYLRDSFRVRGIGWGNTVINELPVSRFDQVWSAGPLSPQGTLAVRSRHSDHRMVVADFTRTPQP